MCVCACVRAKQSERESKMRRDACMNVVSSAHKNFDRGLDCICFRAEKHTFSLSFYLSPSLSLTFSLFISLLHLYHTHTQNSLVIRRVVCKRVTIFSLLSFFQTVFSLNIGFLTTNKLLLQLTQMVA